MGHYFLDIQYILSYILCAVYGQFVLVFQLAIVMKMCAYFRLTQYVVKFLEESLHLGLRLRLRNTDNGSRKKKVPSRA